MEIWSKISENGYEFLADSCGMLKRNHISVVFIIDIELRHYAVLQVS